MTERGAWRGVPRVMWRGKQHVVAQVYPTEPENTYDDEDAYVSYARTLCGQRADNYGVMFIGEAPDCEECIAAWARELEAE